MNFKKQIEQLIQTKSSSIREGNFEILRVPDEKGDRFYVIDHLELLGIGTSGKVFKALAIDAATGDAIEDKIFAAKLIINPDEFRKQEAVLQANYQFTEPPVITPTVAYVVTEFIPGEEILDHERRLHPEVSKLSFAQRLNVICQILLQINLYHHSTPTTGTAIVHTDVKGPNIKLHVGTKTISDPETKEEHEVFDIRVSTLDLGSADPIEDNPNKLIPIGNDLGSSGYIAPEIHKLKSRGTKSDIYSLTPIIMMLLGAEYPFTHKDKKPISSQVKEDYDFDGIFEVFNLPDYPFPLKEYIIQFLERMQQQDYHARPSSDEVLKFFITAYSFVQYFEKFPNDIKQHVIYNAQLNFMAAGLWELSIGKRTIEQFTTSVIPQEIHLKDKAAESEEVKSAFTKTGTVTVDKKLEDFDFENNPEVCQAMLKLQTLGFLNKATIVRLTQETSDALNFAKLINNHSPVQIIEYFQKQNHKFLHAFLRSDIIITWFKATDVSQHRSLLDLLNQQQILLLLGNLDSHKTAISRKFGLTFYDTIHDLVADKALEEITNYKNHKDSLKADEHEGSSLGYKNSDKAQAAKLLIDTIKNGSVDTFFTAENKAARKALGNRRLGEKSELLRDYLEQKHKNLRSGG